MKTLIFLLISQLVLAETLVLELGESKSFRITGPSVWVEKSSILKADSQGGSIALTAKKIGRSQFRVGPKTQVAEVLSADQIELFKQLQDFLKTKPGLKTDIEEGQVNISGYLHDWPTWKSLSEKSWPAIFAIRANLSSSLKDNLQKLIDQDLKTQGLLSVNVIQHPFLEVRLNPKQPSLDRYQSYFSKIGIPIKMSEDSLEMAPVIRVDITVVELKKNAKQKLGMEWPAVSQFDILPGRLVTSDTLTATLHALENRGEAKLLASPNIICRSGKEAEFLAGGEFPIKIANFKMHDIVWKKYGILLKIKPQADSTGRISLSIETEVSSLGGLVDGIPSIHSNRVSSHFDLSHSQVIALSGLLSDQQSKGASGLPFLTGLPILGPLFSSEEFIKEKTELVIFVRPKLMDLAPSEDLKQGAQHVVNK